MTRGTYYTQSILFLATLAIAALLTYERAYAQDVDRTSPTRPLAAKQNIARDRLLQLEDRMFRLVQQLAKTDPGQAERLQAALSRSREEQLRQRMTDLIELLDKDALTEAVEGQAAMLKDLQGLLDALLADDVDIEQQQKKLETMQELQRRIDALLEQQQQLREQTRQHAENAAQAEQIEQAVQQLEKLLRRQQAAMEKSAAAAKGQPSTDAAEATQQQAAIRAETQKVTERLQQQSASDLSKAIETLQRAVAQMADAERPLSSGQFDRAVENQGRALESLQQAIEQLAPQAAQRRQSGDPKKTAQGQRATAGETEKLAQDFNEPRPDGSQAPLPGKDAVEQAGQQMQKAAESIESQSFDAAGPPQEQAMQKLREAKDALDEALRQLSQEQQEAMLRRLEDRFRQMLATQIGINDTTQAVAAKERPDWTRTDELTVAKLSRDEADLATQADDIHAILVDDGTTVVFPEMVNQLAADLRLIGDRLGRGDVSIKTQSLQANVVQMLEQLLDAVRQMQKQQAAAGQLGPPMPGESRPPPLLPNSAELKLLRSCQDRVHKQTQEFHEQRIGEASLTEGDKTLLDRISDRQNDIAEMARQLQQRSQGQ